MFQTPRRGDPLWRSTYQDYSELVGYARVKYATGRLAATVYVNATMNPRRYSDLSTYKLVYDYNG